MAQYYTTMQIWNQTEDFDEVTVSKAQHDELQQKIDALNADWLKFWNAQLDKQVTSLKVKLSDGGNLLQILVNTKSELADDTWDAMEQSIFYTTGFDTYDVNAVPLLKAIKDVTGGSNVSTQWNADISLISPEYTDVFTKNLSDDDAKWFEQELVK